MRYVCCVTGIRRSLGALGIYSFFPLYGLCEITDGKKLANIKILCKYKLVTVTIVILG